MSQRFKSLRSDITISELFRIILSPEKNYYIVAVVYGIAISLLMLAVPISVQALINTVVNTTFEYFIYVLACILFFVLILMVIVMACREYIMELFQRRFFARMTAEANLRLLYSDQQHVETINRTDLVNRFFEVSHVQKSVPKLLTHGFSIALQIVVGLTVISFYHPYLLIYSAIFSVSLYFVWKMWSQDAIKHAQAVSNQKYDLVHWMEEIARAGHFFKSEKTIDYAIKISDEKTNQYLKSKKKFFKTTFSQSLSLFLLICLAHACLLGVGGRLVSLGQLSIGQLIGAELIMAAIIYNLSYVSGYMRTYYELCASIDKLGYFFSIPTEKDQGDLKLEDITSSISFNNVMLKYRNHEFSFNMRIPFGRDVIIKCMETSGSKVFCDLMRVYRSADSGVVEIDGRDIQDFNKYTLREKIAVVDSPLIVESSIRSLFHMANPQLTSSEISALLEAVGIKEAVSCLPQGLDTVLMPTGYPLLLEEVLCLKLAVILAMSPKVLVITEVFDALEFTRRQKIVDHILKLPDMTVICFSNKLGYTMFDRYFVVDYDATYEFKNYEDFRYHVKEGPHSNKESY